MAWNLVQLSNSDSFKNKLFFFIVPTTLVLAFRNNGMTNRICKLIMVYGSVILNEYCYFLRHSSRHNNNLHKIAITTSYNKSTLFKVNFKL